MKKRLIALLIGAVLVIGGVLPLFVLPASATGTHGLYLECRANVTNYKTDGFMIDFYSDSSNALATYWSNANWNMYTGASEAKLGYNNISGGGAYAGLQYNNNDHYYDGIMSMWRWEYRDRNGDTQYLYADTMVGSSTHYSHEGSGTSCIMPYAWQFGQWYRELLFCWDDEETGETFIGTWFYDYNADEWTLFTYYNTHLVESYINTDVNQFLENYYDRYNNRLRNWRYKNVYFLPHGGSSWVSQPTVKMSTDYNVDAVGVFDMGISSDRSYVWGYVDGSNGQNVADPNYQHVEHTYTLSQPSQPTLGSVQIASFDVADPANIRWTPAQNSTPQLAYELVLTDVTGAELARRSGTRPEVRSLSLPDIGTNAYKCTLTVRDVFGNTTTVEETTAMYDELLTHGNAQPVNYDDVDRNGEVNIGDVTAMLNGLSAESEYDADLDGNGTPDINDVTLLLDVLGGNPVNRYSKGLIYTLGNDGSYTVASVGNCADTAIRIPQIYAGKAVTAIGAYAFAHCAAITSVELPQSVKSIGVYAFAACEALESIVMPSSLTALGESAFARCSSLTAATVPEGLSSVGKNTFNSCASLATVTLPALLTRVYEGAFDGCTALTTVNYTGTAWSRVRILERNDPLLGASVSFEQPQEPKNGFVQEDGGIRYYVNNVMQTGWKTFGENTLYFFPDTGLMATGVAVIDGTNYYFTRYNYDGIKLWRLGSAEPDKDDPDAWIPWLIEIDSTSEDPHYQVLSSGEPFNVTCAGCSDPSPFEVWDGHYQLDLRISKSSLDLTENLGKSNYPYTWELYYRKARTNDPFSLVRTAPHSASDGDDPVYRIDAFNDGLTDLETANGAPQEYEFVLVLCQGGTAAENVVAWKQLWISYTDSSEEYKQDARRAGFISLEGDDPYYSFDGYILPETATCSNIYSFGAVNSPLNLLDGNDDTVCGAGFNGNQSMQVFFKRPEMITEIYVQCKNEGTTTDPSGSRGTYSVYAVYGGDETLIAENVPAKTKDDGGCTLTLDTPLPAESVKVRITSWTGDQWACVADLRVKANGDTPSAPKYDSQGHILNMTATRSGFDSFGDINKPENVLDGDQNTVCGSGFNANTEQSVTVTFPENEMVSEVFVQCKNEGTTTNSNGSRGTYSIYAIYACEETLVAQNVPAMTGSDGGYTVTLASPVPASAIKVVITSWQGNCWACVADIAVKATGDAPAPAPVLVTGMTASSSGFVSFGDINKPENVLDGDQTTVCGSGFSAGTEQSVTVSFGTERTVAKVFVQCKNEGTTTNSDGTRGTYDIYVLSGGTATRVAQSVPAVTGTDGGYLCTLNTPTAGTAVKVVITSWQGNCWACVADIAVYAEP